jgi:hypothetical protein
MPNGLTNAAEWQTMGKAGLLDPTWAHTYADDFDRYTAADWSLTGTGTPAAALIAGDGGIMQLSTTSGASDSIFFQKTPAAFSVPTNVATAMGKQLFFKMAGKLAAIDGAFYTGIADIGEGAEGSTVDGILINKAAGVGTLTLDIFVASAKTSFAFPAACVIAANTYFEVGFRIDPLGNVEGFFNPTTGINPINASVAATSVQPRGAVVLAPVPTLPTTNMAPVVGYVNGSANARNNQVDYLVVSKER